MKLLRQHLELLPDTFVFGCEQLGGFNWGVVDARSVADAIHLAFEKGIVCFDTADCYGRGLSESRLGSILSKKRKNAFIASKFGVRFDNAGKVFFDNSREWAGTALEQSLRRLGTDYIDLYQVHHWDNLTPLDEIFDQLERFIEQGKIRSYGLTNFPKLPLKHQGSDQFQTLSLEFSLANREYEEEILGYRGRNFFFLSYGSLGQGILSGKYKSASQNGLADRRSEEKYTNFHGQKYQHNLRIVRELRSMSAELGVPVPKIAVAWIRSKVKHCMPIIGIKNINQLSDFTNGENLHLNRDMMNRLSQVSQG